MDLDCHTIDHTIDTICTSTTSMTLEGAMELVSPSRARNKDKDKDVATGTTSIAEDTNTNTKEEELVPSPMTEASDLSRLDRIIWVVTTAALPWRTGTSVNPLARALYLTRGRPKHAVTLMVPFLPALEEQAQVFGKDKSFTTEAEQEEWIRTYCVERVNCKGEFAVRS
jgi:hypothetical protein